MPGRMPLLILVMLNMEPLLDLSNAEYGSANRLFGAKGVLGAQTDEANNILARS